jgi:hypothetical protein
LYVVPEITTDKNPAAGVSQNILDAVVFVVHPNRVEVVVGSVSVPVFTIEAMTGVVSVGEVAKTKLPLPVSSETEDAS